tara:strand:+ start:2142 stop:2390 length:249 start_codon:yes stop_codon:yes gene_type:complete
MVKNNIKKKTKSNILKKKEAREKKTNKKQSRSKNNYIKEYTKVNKLMKDIVTEIMKINKEKLKVDVIIKKNQLKLIQLQNTK